MNWMLFLLTLFSGFVLADVSAVDSNGVRLTLASPAQRIISFAPHVTELLFAAGAGAKVVAVSDYSDYPETAAALPRVASSSAIDLERVLALKPDLAVAWRLSATERVLDRLQTLGVPVFYSEPHRLADIPDAVEAMGALAGTTATARGVALDLRAALERLRAKYRGKPVVSVFYQISERPLMTVNREQFISDALALCGASNVFGSLPIIAPTVTAEAVIAADPQVIIAARLDPADISWHGYWERFGALRAVRDGNLLTVRADEMHRHGPRAIPAAARLCELLEGARVRTIKAAIPR